MADLPMAQAPQIGMPSIPYMGNMGTGAAEGAKTGTNTFLQEQQIMNQQALYQVEMQKMKAQVHQQQVDSALNFMGKIGEQLKYFSPNTQKQAIANGMNTLSKVAPEFGIQPTDASQIPDEGIDLVTQFGKLRAAHQKGEVSDPDFMQESGNLMNQMSQFQREMLKEQESVIGNTKYEPGQSPTGQPTLLNTGTGQQSTPSGQPITGQPFAPTTTVMREQNTRQMGAAGANAGFVNSLKDYHTAVSGLARGDQIGDRTAILAASKFLGETPDSMKKLAQSGFFGKNIESGITKIWGTGDMTPEQRADFQAVLDTHKQGLEKASAIQTSMYPGATGPNLSTHAQPITKTLKNGKHVISSDGGKTWFYSK